MNLASLAVAAGLVLLAVPQGQASTSDSDPEAIPQASAATPDQAGEEGGTTDPSGPTANSETAASVPAPAETTEIGVEWNAPAGTLSAHAERVPVDTLARALEAAGVDVKTHPSWETRRISASFDDLPLAEAAKHLFERSYVLVWSRAAAAADAPGERPRIVLLALQDDPPEETGDKNSGPPPDASTLEALAESGAGAEATPALEAALRRGDAELRAAALGLLARHRRLAVAADLLREVARQDADPALRKQALGLVFRSVDHATVESLAAEARSPGLSANASNDPPAPTASGAGAVETLKAAAGGDPDPEVRDAAEAALDNLAARAEFLGSLSEAERNWLFREDDIGPLDKQLEAIERARRD